MGDHWRCWGLVQGGGDDVGHQAVLRLGVCPTTQLTFRLLTLHLTNFYSSKRGGEKEGIRGMCCLGIERQRRQSFVKNAPQLERPFEGFHTLWASLLFWYPGEGGQDPWRSGRLLSACCSRKFWSVKGNGLEIGPRWVPQAPRVPKSGWVAPGPQGVFKRKKEACYVCFFPPSEFASEFTKVDRIRLYLKI
jgi:hypothetical protein